MLPRFDLTFDLSAEEYLSRLRQYGADWHESRIPLELRQRSVYGVRVQIREGSRFTLRLRPFRRGFNLECHGHLVNRQSWSELHGRIALGRTDTLGLVLLGAFWLAILLVTHAPLLVWILFTSLSVIAISGILHIEGNTAARKYETLLRSIPAYRPDRPGPPTSNP